MEEEFNCENGKYAYYNITVRDHDEHAMLTLPQIIQFSSNIGVIKVMERVGTKSLYQTSRDFGFGSTTGISLAGETSGKLSTLKNWSAVSLGQLAMGHEVGVTAIQLASAYCAIANGGYLLKPRIIKNIEGLSIKEYSNETQIIRKVMDVKESKKLFQKNPYSYVL